MTDGQWLFVTFLALYLVECLRWLPPQAFLFQGRPETGKLRWRRAGMRFRLVARAPVLLPWLPPFPAWSLGSTWRLVPEASGLRVKADSARARDRILPWEQVEPRLRDGRLLLAEQTELITSGEREAAAWRDLCQHWKSLPPEQRGAAFTEWALTNADPEKLRQKLEGAETRTHELRVVGFTLFGWCYGVISLIYWLRGEGPALLTALAILLTLLAGQAYFFRRACQAAGPNAPAHWRWKLLGMLFFPPMAMRAADHLLAATDLPPHPLAARPWMKPEAWQALARELWRDARYRPGWSTPEAAPNPEEQALRAILAQAGVTPEELDPAPEAPAGQRWCPRCHALFSAPEASYCQDCGGVELAGPAGSRA